MTAVAPPAKPFSSLFPQGVNPEEVISLLNGYGLPKGVGRIAVGYMLNVFGPSEWRKVRHIDVGDAHSLSDEDINFLLGPDPVDASLQAWKTHIVVYGPQIFTSLPHSLLPRTLRNLQLGIKAMNLSVQSDVLEQIGDEAAKDSSWLIYRVGVVERNESAEKQKKVTSGLGYMPLPCGIDIVTVISCIFAWTGEFHLGTKEGIEKTHTYTNVCQKVKLRGGIFPIEVGGTWLDRGTPKINANYYFEGIKFDYRGVACLRKSQSPTKVLEKLEHKK